MWQWRRGPQRCNWLAAMLSVASFLLLLQPLLPSAVAFPFPPGFKWGVATAAYQVEGGWLEGGKSLSIWDVLAHTPGRINNSDTGDVACDVYHRYMEDIHLMNKLSVKNYRLSISWPRVLPMGTAGGVNAEGVAYYRALLQALIQHGITPYVTLFHWDLPAILELEKSGWLNEDLVDEFAFYAETCFRHFGDLVKWWFTFNEPTSIVLGGYVDGRDAPGRSAHPDVEPYLVGHTILLAHAKAVAVYRTKFQPRQGGQIGIVLSSLWSAPRNVQDTAAAQRAMEFDLGWFADPVTVGDYPISMRHAVGKRLPVFSPEQQALLRGSADFFALNHYTSCLVSEGAGPDAVGPRRDCNITYSKDDSWPMTDTRWAIYPAGMRRLLKWTADRYPGLDIYIAENGVAVYEPTNHDALHDKERIQYLRNYLIAAHEAITKDNVPLRGYFAWSFIDNFEWTSGYSKTFGLVRVDRKDNLKRIPKASALWYAEVMRSNGIPAEA